ncbi:hypothetical protein yrohd0001_30840 [Yersinia rohdei ATCC 43380]|nr:hypothetical protein yrohd0001_30840 [Yersinia rohdei ATCC 43380]
MRVTSGEYWFFMHNISLMLLFNAYLWIKRLHGNMFYE